VLPGVAATAREADPHLRVSGTRFVTHDGRPFEWRGITAFRLVEFVAHGREAEAEAYLKWAASKKLTVVRVLAMTDLLFKLSPGDGVRALPRLLELAAAQGLYVEVVALADTATIPVDIPAHVTGVGKICARYGNALIEIANEPDHPTQRAEVHDPAYLLELAQRLPRGVPVALGSLDESKPASAATYVTWHAPRHRDHVTPLRHGAELVRIFRRPVVSDEPIGAADAAIPGRRDNDPERFRAAAVETRRAGLGATFHYEGGLHARLPTRIEAACLNAWLAGLSGGK
jgi:hypothetical protein